ncbi:MAG: 6-phosphogluconolactonase [Verrucomicrobia bacterium]|nr:6-phosphogluconolactonase [Verrucomicrobiota bacterium]
MNRKLCLFETEQEAIAFCTSHFLQEAKKALLERGTFAVALSGGSTPKKFFQALSDAKETLDWSNIVLFWSDERAVAPDHPDSNFGMAMHYLGKKPFNEAKMFRMEAERTDADAAAREYERLIHERCPEGRFDIVYLGVGEDGHTASLFPHTSALTVRDRKVVANYVEAKKSWRMTLTFPCINEARNIVVLALGPSKAPIIKEIFNPVGKELLPAALVGTQETPALFICDRAAANE